ncbi:DUF2778 domain-containing protein [Paraburkholderia diazotrophica]|uniref:Tlde1 domain-containing protein n=1 Tax=Paraburkholderia diazotrophica TaxID=667676 RepID=A0A1H6YV27_9BURK|nr:DUF2778 domain-containing protein [Paraburkholderia diazotrophica]SEJ41202.1 Protein of unknown function [Paraburkholderia diazotrophica]
MPVRCTFLLNDKITSSLYCSGFGSVEAYSGQKQGRDNPRDTALPNIGPLPAGTYYLVDRQSGGMFGWARDLWYEYGWGSSDHTKWFALWNPNGGDTTMINGIRRGSFRLHPEGPMRLSEGCITVVNPSGFDQLQRFIRSRKPDLPVPGSALRAYGTVDVR